MPMQSANEYLCRTESATRKLFDSIDTYVSALAKAPPPIFSESIANDADHRVALERWFTEHEEQVRLSLKAQHDFSAESFALATLCGCVLQIAATGIQWFSHNRAVPADFGSVIKPSSKAVPFCVGRRVRMVPIGLIIYAGRNQFAHLDENSLREPNLTVFERLATKHGYSTDPAVRDPAFDLRNEYLINFSSNVTALIDWRSYDQYAKDMSAIIGV
ncbi:MAG: hypothetical protein HOP35_13640 [Nitrospira sp.]|nr:hypothetical protein [Nitrospira sp.]